VTALRMSSSLISNEQKHNLLYLLV